MHTEQVVCGAVARGVILSYQPVCMSVTTLVNEPSLMHTEQVVCGAVARGVILSYQPVCLSVCLLPQTLVNEPRFIDAY